jgi:hypothetical protein
MAGSHVVLGVAAWIWAAPYLGLPSLSRTAIALATAGALLPDIDNPVFSVGGGACDGSRAYWRREGISQQALMQSEWVVPQDQAKGASDRCC